MDSHSRPPSDSSLTTEEKMAGGDKFDFRILAGKAARTRTASGKVIDIFLFLMGIHATYKTHYALYPNLDTESKLETVLSAMYQRFWPEENDQQKGAYIQMARAPFNEPESAEYSELHFLGFLFDYGVRHRGIDGIVTLQMLILQYFSALKRTSILDTEITHTRIARVSALTVMERLWGREAVTALTSSSWSGNIFSNTNITPPLVHPIFQALPYPQNCLVGFSDFNGFPKGGRTFTNINAFNRIFGAAGERMKTVNEEYTWMELKLLLQHSGNVVLWADLRPELQAYTDPVHAELLGLRAFVHEYHKLDGTLMRGHVQDGQVQVNCRERGFSPGYEVRRGLNP